MRRFVSLVCAAVVVTVVSATTAMAGTLVGESYRATVNESTGDTYEAIISFGPGGVCFIEVQDAPLAVGTYTQTNGPVLAQIVTNFSVTAAASSYLTQFTGRGIDFRDANLNFLAALIPPTITGNGFNTEPGVSFTFSGTVFP